MKTKQIAGMVALATLALAAPAFAQQPANPTRASGTGGENVQVTSELLNADAEGRAVYTNNVDVLQGNTRLKADKLTVIANCTKVQGKPTDCSDIQRFIAEGNVYYITPDEKIRGDRAEYDYENDVITMTGNDVVLTRGADAVISGRKLVYDVKNGKASVTGDENSKGVISVFTSKPKRDEPAAPAAPAATPPKP